MKDGISRKYDQQGNTSNRLFYPRIMAGHACYLKVLDISSYHGQMMNFGCSGDKPVCAAVSRLCAYHSPLKGYLRGNGQNAFPIQEQKGIKPFG